MVLTFAGIDHVSALLAPQLYLKGIRSPNTEPQNRIGSKEESPDPESLLEPFFILEPNHEVHAIVFNAKPKKNSESLSFLRVSVLTLGGRAPGGQGRRVALGVGLKVLNHQP